MSGSERDSIAHPAKASRPIVVNAAGHETETGPRGGTSSQFVKYSGGLLLKASSPILVTVCGIIRDFIFLHALKAEGPILVNVDGSARETRRLHSAKQDVSIVFRPSDMETEVSCEHM